MSFAAVLASLDLLDFPTRPAPRSPPRCRRPAPCLSTILELEQATDAPVIGVALTAEVPGPGSATGASQPADIQAVIRFALEVAKAFGAGRCHFHDAREWAELLRLYGPMTHLLTPGGALRIGVERSRSKPAVSRADTRADQDAGDRGVSERQAAEDERMPVAFQEAACAHTASNLVRRTSVAAARGDRHHVAELVEAPENRSAPPGSAG